MAQPTPANEKYATLFTQVNQSGVAFSANLDASIDEALRGFDIFHGEASNGNPMGKNSLRNGLTFAERAEARAALLGRTCVCTDYRNSTHISQAPTTHLNYGETSLVEADAPLGISTYWAGKRTTGAATGGFTLETALAAAAGTATVRINQTSSRPANTPNYYPLIWGQYLDKPGNVWTQSAGRVKAASTTAITSDSTQSYVSWFRIDDEIFGLTAQPSVSGGVITVQVRRGMWGTTPAAHSAGARVFVPAFIGKSSGIAASDDQYSGLPTRESIYQLRYTLQVDRADAVAFLADQFTREASDIQADAADPYAGDPDWYGVQAAHCDICSPVQYNIADAWGNGVTLWDHAMGTTLTTARFAAWQLSKVQRLRTHFPDKQFHLNNYEPQDIDVQYVADLVAEGDAVTLENWLAKYETAGNLAADWEKPLKLLLRCAQNDWGVLAWPRWEYAEATWTNQYQHKRFAYATYLLAYRPGLTRFAFGSNWGTSGGTLNLPEDLFFYDLGDPQADYTSVAAIPQTVPGLYRRNFTKGIVLVNPTTSSKTFTVPGDATYYRVGNNSTLDAITEVSGDITVSAKDAAILVRDTEDTVVEDRSARITWAEFRTPNDGRRTGLVTVASLEVPNAVAERFARVTWAAFEVGELPPRGLVLSFAELEAPDRPNRGAVVTWANLQVPDTDKRGAVVTWAELRLPNRGGRTIRGADFALGLYFNPFRIVIRQRRRR